MNTYIALLRGINVSGQKIINMADLRSLFEKLGFFDVRSYIQSGNIIFGSEQKRNPEELAREIEQALHEKFSFHVPVIIRTRQQLEDLTVTNPFQNEADYCTSKHHVVFLERHPGENILERFRNHVALPDLFHAEKMEFSLYTPDGYGKSKLTNNFIEKLLNVKATARNWKTVCKILEMTNLR